MRTKTKIVYIIYSAIFMIMFASPAFAITDCASATVKQVGSYPGGATDVRSSFIVKLDCANDAKWSGDLQFYLDKDIGEAGLAVFLTAQSLELPVWVRVSAPTSGSLLHIVYLNSPTSN